VDSGLTEGEVVRRQASGEILQVSK
jgi:hypothetical protein